MKLIIMFLFFWLAFALSLCLKITECTLQKPFELLLFHQGVWARDYGINGENGRSGLFAGRHELGKHVSQFADLEVDFHEENKR